MEKAVQELSVEKLRQVCDPASFHFKSTEELEKLDDVIGQERAVRAVSSGIGIESPGYHMFALGPAGTGRTTTAELYALLSSLSGLPLRQDLAVTGSVNQLGEVQAIGGVNEKVEGFFEVCKARGLTGEQGVIIPQSNVKHLMLKEEVIEAVKAGKFHVFPVATIEEGIGLLTGIEAGEADEQGNFPEGTVFNAVQTSLQKLAQSVKSFTQPEKVSEDGRVGQEETAV